MATGTSLRHADHAEQDLEALCRGFAPTWTCVEQCPRWHRLTCEDPDAPGATLYLSIDQAARRLVVYGSTHGPGGRDLTQLLHRQSASRAALQRSITLSFKKAPYQLYQEIQSRFLTAYLAAWREAWTCCQAEQGQNDALNAYVRDLAAILQTTRIREATLGTDARIDAYTQDGVSVTFRASHTNYVSMDGMTLNRQQALEMAALIASWKGSNHA